MGEVIRVGMADLNICKAPDTITTIGLGSCIGLTFYDSVAKVGGLVHYMLPDSSLIANNDNIAKFADSGIDELLRRVLQAGAVKGHLVAKIAGGAKMFQVKSTSNIGNIGDKNALAAKKMLAKLGIPLVAEDVGLDYGRTIELHCDTGELHIKAVRKPIKII